MEKSKFSHGGKREGAGRKKLGRELRQTLAVRISPDALKKLEQMAIERGVSKGIVIEYLIENHKE